MRYRRPQNYREKLQDYRDKGIIINNYEGKLEPFQKGKELYLEIGMGKGAFIVEHARRFPLNTYIGIERQESLLISASQKIEDLGLGNVKLIGFNARNIEDIIEEATVSGIYLNFSDPWSKQRYAKRRLTHLSMLKKYEKLLKDKGQLFFKTDNSDLFEFSLGQLEESNFEIFTLNRDLYDGYQETKDHKNPIYIQTEYEAKFREEGKSIFYLECRLNKV